MFPAISNLTEYLFNIKFPLPVSTFGFFVALSFIAAYYIFVSEFKRKEKEGLIAPFKIQEMIGQPASALELFINGALGFIAGYKIIGVLFNYTLFMQDPPSYIFSLKGNLLTGVVCGTLLIYWVHADRKKERRKKPVIVDKEVHPYKLMPLIVFSVGFWGFIGAKLFDCLENWDLFISNPLGQFFSLDGLTYYGGLIFGALSYLYIGYNRKWKLIRLADLGSTGMMAAYAIGRIGCQLSGDGDWGIVNSNIKPGWLNWLPDWAWSSRFPHNVINAGEFIPGCKGHFCYQLPQGVYPTAFYEVIICTLLFAFLWAIRKHLRLDGLMFCIFLILNGLERLFIEMIRVNPRYHLFNLAFTQAELISFAMVLGGVIGLIVILYRYSAGRAMKVSG